MLHVRDGWYFGVDEETGGVRIIRRASAEEDVLTLENVVFTREEWQSICEAVTLAPIGTPSVEADGDQPE